MIWVAECLDSYILVVGLIQLLDTDDGGAALRRNFGDYLQSARRHIT